MNSMNMAWRALLSLLMSVAIWEITPSITAGQLLGGTIDAGTEWRPHRKVGHYYSDFGAVVFDSDNNGADELYMMGGEIGDSPHSGIVMIPDTPGGHPTNLGNAPWSARSRFKAVAFDGCIWVFAGKETATADVWLTYDPQAGAAAWIQAPDAPWSLRWNYSAIVFNGKVWLLGGDDGQSLLNEVWSFDGVNWQKESDAPWPGRDGFTTAVLGGELFVIGGRGRDANGDYVLGDVWKTADGENWTLVTPLMEDVGPIREHATVTFSDRIWILGGTVSTDDTLYDESLEQPISVTDAVWFSWDGATWYPASNYGETAWPRLRGHEAVLFQPPKHLNAHSAYLEFPRIMFMGGTNNRGWSPWLWTDRRDHEIAPYSSPQFMGDLPVESPKGRASERITSSTMTVTEDFLISDVSVKLRMRHDQWQDISLIRLVHEYVDEQGNPQQRAMGFLFNERWSGTGLLDTIFMPEGGVFGHMQVTMPFILPDPELKDRYLLPNAQNLSWFQGFTAKGKWTLEITDTAKENDGNLYEWRLDFRGMEAPPTPGVTVTPVDGLMTTEAGGQAAFDVVLDTAPASDVTIEIASSDPSEGTVSVASLTFTTENYDAPQTVTITGVDDGDQDGNIAYVITTTALSEDVIYNSIDPSDVSVTNQDNEESGGGKGKGGKNR